jgi:hypothetical protein
MSGLTVFTEYVVLKWILGSDNPRIHGLLAAAYPSRPLPGDMGVQYLGGYYQRPEKEHHHARQPFSAAGRYVSVLLKEAELFKLRQQLQPHFLYNSLNSISALIMISPEKAQEMIGKLSDFLRSSVKREAEDKIPVSEELNYIQSYLAIESIRFGDACRSTFKKTLPTMPLFRHFPVAADTGECYQIRRVWPHRRCHHRLLHIALEGQCTCPSPSPILMIPICSRQRAPASAWRAYSAGCTCSTPAPTCWKQKRTKNILLLLLKIPQHV